MSTTIEPLNQTIALPGCTLSPTALVFNGEPTDEDLTSIGLSLQRIEGCKAWWWGDFLVKQEKRHGEHYTKQYAEITGLEPQTLRRYKMVAKYFDPLRRRNDLSWNHHLEAMLADSSSTRTGQKWIDKAADENLSVPRLRAAIRLSKRDPRLDDNTKPPEETYSEVLMFNRWCRKMLPKAGEFSQERATAILDDLREAVQLLDSLKRIAE